MKRILSIFFVAGLAAAPAVCLAADSYRWLHVTIDTPWMIFLFLLPMVLIPAILMAVLYWKFAGTTPESRKREEARLAASKDRAKQSESTD
ncbi:MAG: hypothetical protein L3J89_01350 [Gammaproteobacteria bacterium]|nr:hypothetical protein [Gammaproteobacteria bacterium]